MKCAPAKISLSEWDERYEHLCAQGLHEPAYGGPLRRHVECGDRRLLRLKLDNSAAALRLWNFLLSEEDRLRGARRDGKRIVGTMKDLGTVPVMVYALPEMVAFYPDGAWWVPCVMEMSDGLFDAADRLGIDESFCPVRAMLGAFSTGTQFPRPDLLIASVGAVCDDFSAIAQRLEGMGERIFWWEIPRRRKPETGERGVKLPGGFVAPMAQVEFVSGELARVRQKLEAIAGRTIDDAALAAGIRAANRVRRLLDKLRRAAYGADPCPLPALEMLVAEMLAIHFCSDREEAALVLADLLAEARRRAAAGEGVLAPDAARIFWVNPVADLRVMNLLEDCGGRICGTDYMFCHALGEIPEDCAPMTALAMTALGDPMIGAAEERGEHVCREIQRFGAEGVIVSRIPGASHCATEGRVIAEVIHARLGLPVVEIEVPPLTDAIESSLRGRTEALVETIQARRVRAGQPQGAGR